MERKAEEISQELEQNTKEGENRKEKNCSVKELSSERYMFQKQKRMQTKNV